MSSARLSLARKMLRYDDRLSSLLHKMREYLFYIDSFDVSCHGAWLILLKYAPTIFYFSHWWWWCKRHGHLPSHLILDTCLKSSILTLNRQEYMLSRIYVPLASICIRSYFATASLLYFRFNTARSMHYFKASAFQHISFLWSADTPQRV